ncbi:response regulator [Salidesulfovibrio onnuriiensis]|uniref:response regulator n=1 Tax=Salidesulfovibrio onnuriiensis TaxID=2583823 RepID=UPI0011CB51DB|nr:response regulator [Salidesulfovibrio onnuriiensis]
MPEKSTLLIVDDSPDNIWFLSENLKDDFALLYATSGKEALEIANSAQKIDLILLDIIMPEMDGFEVCRVLKSDPQTKGIPVVFLTSRSLEEDEAKGFELGAQDYITKPFSIKIVKARVSSILNLERELQRRLELKNQMEELNKQLEAQVKNRLSDLEKAQHALKTYEERYQSIFHNRPDKDRKKRLLIVDDVADNIFILRNNLADKYEVLYSINGQEALKTAFSEDSPDLILLDIMMPGMDGYEVCARLKADIRTRDIPVIFITALGEDVDQVKGLEYGAVDYITKPFSMPVVQARIQAVLHLKTEMDRRLNLTRELEDMNRELEKRVRERAQELRLTEKRLKLTEEKYKSIFENAIEGVFQTTREGRFLNANPALVELFGYSSVSELINSVTNIREQLYASPEVRDEYSRLLEEKGEVDNFEAEFRKKNGQKIWLSISAKKLTNSNDDSFYQGFVVDISRRKTAEDDLERINRELEQLVEARTEELRNKTRELELANTVLRRQDEMKTELVSSVSHDLRTPLTSLLGFTKLISKEFINTFQPLSEGEDRLQKKSKRIVDNLEIIATEGERLTRLINDFLDISKIEEGRIEWDDQEVDLAAVFAQSIRAVQGDFAEKKSVSLSTEVHDDVPRLILDPDRIIQVLVNLLNNAAKHTFEGSVHMAAEVEPSGAVVVRISDTGTGIPPDKLETIFDKFQQVTKGDTMHDAPKGSGLGLTICRKILDHYGGRIWAESKLDMGSTFFFRLPVRCRADAQ